jgi:hypothetical protein
MAAGNTSAFVALVLACGARLAASAAVVAGGALDAVSTACGNSNVWLVDTGMVLGKGPKNDVAAAVDTGDETGASVGGVAVLFESAATADEVEWLMDSSGRLLTRPAETVKLVAAACRPDELIVCWTGTSDVTGVVVEAGCGACDMTGVDAFWALGVGGVGVVVTGVDFNDGVVLVVVCDVVMSKGTSFGYVIGASLEIGAGKID